MNLSKQAFFIICFNLIFPYFLFTNTYNSSVPTAVGTTNIIENSIQYNPSILNELNKDFLLLQIQPNKFNIKDLNPFSLIIAKTFEKFSTGLSINAIGNYIYNEFNIAIIISTSLTKDFQIGTITEISRLYIKDYNTHTNMTFNIGGKLNLSDKFQLGIAFSNLNRGYFEGGEKTANLSSLFGIGYVPIENCLVELGTSIKIGGNSGLYLTTNYKILELVKTKFGIKTNPRTLEIGASIPILNYAKIGLETCYNDYLGFVPLVSILFYY